MAFIRLRNLKTDETGQYLSGTAALVETVYDATASGHSRQSVKERLGKVAWLSDDRKSGIFLSPTRGLVQYDVRTDEFESVTKDDARLRNCSWIPDVQPHTNFGDVYLLLSFLEGCGFLQVLRNMLVTQDEYERVLAHTLHGFLRDGSSIKCSTFVEQSAVSYLLVHLVATNLACDYRYFERMGSASAMSAFFRAFVAWMRKIEPEFGKACYVDSTELPSEARNNPYVHLRTERGVTKEEMRLALILDKGSGLPVWYTIFPGNMMDVNTLRDVIDEVYSTLNIRIDSLVLDSGYASKDVIQTYGCGQESSLILRMPARRGYPYKTLYHQLRSQFDQPKYFFMREDSVYYGRQKSITLFNTGLFAYVYVDKERALIGLKDFMKKHTDLYAQMKDKERKWLAVHAGYFVLLSNKDRTPSELLDLYISRTHIEAVFKSAKSFEGLMPLAKWNEQSVRGKILQDVILTVIRALLLKATSGHKGSLADLFHEAASVACFIEPDDRLRVETPNKQARLAYKQLRLSIPSSVLLSDWRERILLPR